MMKPLIQTIIIATSLFAAAISFGQTSPPVTRAQVRAELILLEQTGYSPGGSSDLNYPADIMAAEKSLHAQN